MDAFLDDLRRSGGAPAVHVAHGQCLETIGQPEPYLPIFEAMERFIRANQDNPKLLEVLTRYAPSWLAQMPSLAMAGAAATAEPVPGRMLRELLAAVTELTTLAPLVLVLEDAHWADFATTDACVALSRSRDPARLLIIATMRKAEAMVTDHPISAASRELVARNSAVEIDLEPFEADAVADYLRLRNPDGDRDPELVEWLLRHTAGNPLFVRLIVDDWVARDVLPGLGDKTAAKVLMEVPDSLRTLLERQLARLGDAERAALEAAGVLQGDFDPAAIAALIERSEEDVDSLLRSVARRGQLLRRLAQDGSEHGSHVGRYAFLHATV